jgi:hypothetical protein
MTTTPTIPDDSAPATIGYVRGLIEAAMRQRDKASQDASQPSNDSSASAPESKKTGDDGELSDTAKTRIINSELKAEAVKAGLMDLDFLKLIDRSKLRVTKDGVSGIESALADLKASKPSLFETASTSSASTAPKAGVAERFDATKATAAQIAERLAQLSGRRGV